MFFDNITIMMSKQHMSDYLYSHINILKLNPMYYFQPFIVQVISSDHIADGIYNYLCKFKKTVKKGSFIRLVKWNLDLKNYEFQI